MTELPILSVAGLAKKHARSLARSARYAVADLLSELRPFRAAAPELRADEFWALRDVSFELCRGEAIAVIGSNGAGKSTLLRLVAGLIKPDAGEIRLRGRAAAMIELAAGFNPALSGLENVRLGAALHGLAERETAGFVEQVTDFAGLDGVIDAPVQTYSAGMRSRLAFALHAALEPDLLLVDEVLAVGDLAFQHKCLRHMRSFLERGGAALFVSHSPHQIQAICDRGLLLEAGRVAFEGSAAEALDLMFAMRSSPSQPEAIEPSAGAIAIESVATYGEEGVIRTGESMRLRLRYRAAERCEALLMFSIWTADRWICITRARSDKPRILEPGIGELECCILQLPLVAGRYIVRAALIDPATKYPIALFGQEGPGLTLDVHPAADPEPRIVTQLSHLVRVDVDWN